MLNDLQLEILSDAIRPLFQYLEREVVLDIARRVQKTMTYTRTAELMAMDMQKLGYSPNKIRSDVMKVLRADEAYQKAVEANTIAYKKEIKKLIDETVKQATEMGNDIVSNAGNMSWVDDMSVWESAGRALTDNSFLHDLQKAIAEQTVEEMVNLTRTMGFKTMSGYEAVANAYRNELDKAVIKICTGTFSQEKVLNDVIHNLAQSGLRSIDYSSGYSMQIDTAAKTAIRTGCGQISAKIMDENLIRTGQNLVYVSKHWGARSEGIGVANHAMWQGQVYFIKPGENYTEEAERIGQDRIMDIWYSTGYSPDGSHVNNPLGLHGYNCRHSHRVWFLGTSTLPEEQPEPSPVKINGKEYDYPAMTKRMRYLERGIRALKREQIAREALRLPCTEIKAKIKQKTREYKEFCNKCNVPERTTNLRVDSTAADVTKTKAYERYQKILLENDSGMDSNYIPSSIENIIEEFKTHLPNVQNKDAKILLEQSLGRVDVLKSRKINSYYDGHKVYLSELATPDTLAHELFHEIDDTYGLTEYGLLRNSVIEDYTQLSVNAGGESNIVKYLKKKYKKAFHFSILGTPKVLERYRGISDIIHGASNGRVFLGYGHMEKGYWTGNAVQEETFAQFGRMLYNQDEDVLHMLKIEFPKTYEEVIDRLKGMIK